MSIYRWRGIFLLALAVVVTLSVMWYGNSTITQSATVKKSATESHKNQQLLGEKGVTVESKIKPKTASNSSNIVSLDDSLSELRNLAAASESARAQLAIEETFDEGRLSGWWIPRPTIEEISAFTNKAKAMKEQIRPSDVAAFDAECVTLTEQLSDYPCPYKLVIFALNHQNEIETISVADSQTPRSISLDAEGRVRGADDIHMYGPNEIWVRRFIPFAIQKNIGNATANTRPLSQGRH